MSEILKMSSIKKTFPGVLALDDVNIELGYGQVLGLLGENGAGKSTLMKILSGIYQPDEGEIYFEGNKVEINGVLDAKDLGIEIIFQELSLSSNMTVAENIFAMNEPLKFGFIDDYALNKNTNEFLQSLSINIKAEEKVRNLSVANQQLVEIAKALRSNPKLIIMDEPTSALSSKETDLLFNIIRRIKSQGTAIIYISHRMEEIFEITETVSVLRDGKYIGTVKTSETSSEELINMMVGRDLDEVYPDKIFKSTSEESLLEVQNYHKEGYYHNITFDLKPGEILGIYGLVGSGRTELVEGIFGILEKESGKLLINGENIDIDSPSTAIKNKIAYVTEDRKDKGLFLTDDVKENITISVLDKVLNKFRLINQQKEKEIAEKNVIDLGIRTPSVNQMVNNLSGGNQQKVVLAKWFEINPSILILDEPTRGIDVGAKYEIYKIMIELASEGVGIVMISSDLPEVLNISDRLLVLGDKEILAELDPKETSQEEIMAYITGR